MAALRPVQIGHDLCVSHLNTIRFDSSLREMPPAVDGKLFYRNYPANIIMQNGSFYFIATIQGWNYTITEPAPGYAESTNRRYCTVRFLDYA